MIDDFYATSDGVSVTMDETTGTPFMPTESTNWQENKVAQEEEEEKVTE